MLDMEWPEQELSGEERLDRAWQQRLTWPSAAVKLNLRRRYQESLGLLGDTPTTDVEQVN